ncbi:DNA/RNA non-specific endonuclease [Larkinella rosea]|uniref:DNA/RNA non-specific endonuclease n=1 Tax=Larkinella rosea TaxID=2025312 RepID=UPI0021CFE293|nr:DNA/RNA non-specific endonuclease [Larkinella rosea]
MTNIVPQAPRLNRGSWNQLEGYTRKLIEGGNEAYILAVWVPNTTGEQSWSSYRVSVDEIESKTGYDLLANVPDAVELVIEKQADKVMVLAVEGYPVW